MLQEKLFYLFLRAFSPLLDVSTAFHHPFYTLSSPQTYIMLPVLWSEKHKAYADSSVLPIKSICFFAECDPVSYGSITASSMCMYAFSLCVLQLFLLQLMISISEVKYPYLHPQLTNTLNWATTCNSTPKNQSDSCE